MTAAAAAVAVVDIVVSSRVFVSVGKQAAGAVVVVLDVEFVAAAVVVERDAELAAEVVELEL